MLQDITLTNVYKVSHFIIAEPYGPLGQNFLCIFLANALPNPESPLVRLIYITFAIFLASFFLFFFNKCILTFYEQERDKIRKGCSYLFSLDFFG